MSDELKAGSQVWLWQRIPAAILAVYRDRVRIMTFRRHAGHTYKAVHMVDACDLHKRKRRYER